MDLLSIPNTPNDITPQWLTEVLTSTGMFHEYRCNIVLS